MLVYVDVQASFDAFGFAKEHQVLKQEDVSLALLPPVPDGELILPDQLALLLQVHLRRRKEDLPQAQNNMFTFAKRVMKRHAFECVQI